MAVGDVTAQVLNPLSYRCAYHDGVDDKITFGKKIKDWSSTVPFTVSLWVYRRYSAVSFQGILSKSADGSSTGVAFDITLNPSANNRFVIYVGDGVESQATQFSTDATKKGQWYNLVVSITGSHIKCWQNGVAMPPVAQTRQYVEKTNYNFRTAYGFSDIPTYLFKGGLRDIQIWNRELTSTEIANVYAGKPILNGLIQRWKLKDDYKSEFNVNNGVNSGTSFTAFETVVGPAFRDARKSANDKYLIAPLSDGKMMTVHIEES